LEFFVSPKQFLISPGGPVGVGLGVGDGEGVGDGDGLTVGDGDGDGDVVLGDGEGDVVLGDGDGDVVLGLGLGLLLVLGEAEGDWLGEPVIGSQSWVNPPLAFVATRH
jgi:hypothetical protein